MRIKKDGTPDKRFRTTEKDNRNTFLLQLYWNLRKSGAYDYNNAGIYMGDGVFLTKNGEFIHTRD